MKQTRMLRTFDIECRSESDGKMRFSGYALKFDRKTNLFGDYYEIIRKEALQDTDMSRVFLLFNHDQSKIIAGTPNGSLKLMTDDIGLRIDAEAVETETSKEVYQLAKSGLLDKMSFSFKLSENSYDFVKQDDGTWLREIVGIDKLYDVAIVTFPAYEDTEVSARNGQSAEMECRSLIEKRVADATERMNKLKWN